MCVDRASDSAMYNSVKCLSKVSGGQTLVAATSTAQGDAAVFDIALLAD